MQKRIKVEVSNKQQARDLEAGLMRPDVRAFAIVMGVLDALPSDKARIRVLDFITAYFSDPENFVAKAFDPEGPKTFGPSSDVTKDTH